MKKLMFSLYKRFYNSFGGREFEKNRWISFVDGFLFKITKPKGTILISCQGNKMYLNTEDFAIARSLLLRGFYEHLETEMFKRSIKPNMVVVDVGANIGYYSLIAAKLVGDNGRIYAFEPEPNNYKLLVKNIEINNYSNIVPIQKAVSNKVGKAKLFVDGYNLGNHSFLESNIKKKAGFIEVETITLDYFFERIVGDNKVNFLKVDAEGAEGIILEGADKILRNKDIKVLIEFTPTLLEKVGTDPLKLLQKFKKYGFNIKFIFYGEAEKAQSLETDEIINISSRGLYHVNLFLEKL
ncbi:MAG: FkbM family methyltransferase [Candidatus Edwardsbacteria bacterium]